MKKILILVAGILLLSAPFFVGSTAETRIDELLEKYNVNPSIQITKLSYDKGWFSSTAKYQVEVVMADDQNLPDMPNFKISQALFHGPVLWKHNGLGFGLMDSTETIDLPDDWKKIQDAFLISSRVAFDGSFDSIITLDSIDIDELGIKVSLMPASGQVQVSKTGHIKVNFDWQGLKAEKLNAGSLEIVGIHLNADQQLIKGELYSPTALYTGNFISTVETVSLIAAAPGASADLSNIEITADSQAREDVIDVNVAFKIAEINAVNQKITHFIYDLSMLNLDIDAMMEFNTLMVDSQQNLQNNPAQALTELYTKAQAILPKLLAKDPELRINNLGFTVEEGTITSEMTLVIDKDKFQIENPDSIIGAVKVDSTGQAPEAFFVKFGLGPSIDAFVQQQLLTRDGANVGFEFKMVDGKTLLNGNEIPLF